MVPVQHVSDDGADGDAVPAVHVQLGDHAGVVGLHIAVLLIVALGLQQVVEGQLGGLDVELELLDVVLHVAGVDAEEHVALVDGLPLLKGGLQNLAADQRGHLVGLDGLDGAGARDGHRHVVHRGGVGQVRAAEHLSSRTHAAGEPQHQQRRDHQEDDQPLDPLPLLLRGRELRAFLPRPLRRGDRRFWLNLGCFHSGFSFSLLCFFAADRLGGRAPPKDAKYTHQTGPRARRIA